MTRKEFLVNFLRCVDTGASTLDFRRYTRVKAQHLPRHIARTQSYRDELARLEQEEKELELRDKRLAGLEAARSARAAKRLETINGETEDAEGSEAEEGENEAGEDGDGEAEEVDCDSDGPIWNDAETLGTREDTGDEPDLHD